MITVRKYDQLNPLVLDISDEAVLQNALVCYRAELVNDLDASTADDRMDRLARGVERTIAQVDHLLEVLA